MKIRIRNRGHGLGIVMGVVILSLGVLSAAQAPANHDRGRIPANLLGDAVRGLQIAPVPLDLRDKELLLVGLGSYIVNA